LSIRPANVRTQAVARGKGIMEAPLFTALTRALTARQSVIPIDRRPLVLDLCLEAVRSATAPTGPDLDGDVAARAIGAAELLLETSCPDLSAALRADLAGVCARVAVAQAGPVRV
jgi:hypothetical protein